MQGLFRVMPTTVSLLPLDRIGRLMFGRRDGGAEIVVLMVL